MFILCTPALQVKKVKYLYTYVPIIMIIIIISFDL